MVGTADTGTTAPQRWVFTTTVAFFYAATVLRSVLVFTGDRRDLVLLLLLVWLALLVAEPALSSVWRPYFTLYVALQSAIVAVLLGMPGFPDFFAILLAVPSMQAMQRWRPGTAVVLIGLFAVLIGLCLADEYGPAQAIAFAAIYTAANVFLAGYALAAKRAAEAKLSNETLAGELQEANRQLADYAQRAKRLAAARERQQLARDLHDSVTQTLFSMTLTAQSALLLLRRDALRAAAQLDQIDHLARSALSEVSLLSSKLPTSPLTEGGLLASLQRHLADRQSKDGLSISLQVDGDDSLPRSDEPVLLRIVQEALNNVVKHAGVSQAAVRLRLRRPFRLEIEDHGEGFETARHDPRGMGLAGMRERAEEIGWRLTVTSSPGAGTHVVATEASSEGGDPSVAD